MKRDGLVSAKRVRELLDYDPATGVLKWKPRAGESYFIRRWNTRYAGTVAGTPSGGDYCLIRIGKVGFYAQRLIWLHVTGKWPSGEVDHIDCNPKNNAWSNLRLATRQQNQMNVGLRKDNRTGYKGVRVHHSKRNPFQAIITMDRKTTTLGCFPTAEQAAAAYATAARKHFGSFARTS